ncbi:hypothetical protein IMY05_017G0009900 [Salix suchowensis]|nr:hypothetical protein IMY05_017G0009900 [Salix suchowensis]
MITTPFHILVLSSELNCRRLLQVSSSTASLQVPSHGIIWFRIFIHASYLETMEAEGFEKVLPEVNTIAEGVRVY